MNIDILIAFLGGAGTFLAPLVCIRALSEAGSAKRSTATAYALVGAGVLCMCLYLALSAWFAAVLGFAAALGLKRFAFKRVEADIVVASDGPLLGDALSPQLAAGLVELEVQARAGALKETPEEPRRLPDEPPLI